MRMRVPETFVSNSCFIKRYIVIFLASGRIIGRGNSSYRSFNLFV